MTKIIAKEYTEFLEQLKEQIAISRYKAARTVNKELLLLYHYIGTQILEKQKSQGWGSKVIEQLSRDLKAEFPEMKGFSTRNLKYMRQFAGEYQDIEFVQQLVAQLPWGHNVFSDGLSSGQRSEAILHKRSYRTWLVKKHHGNAD
ncbi:phage uncharacterized protein [Wolbachia endosymbiont of Culex quinquefasciatus JHB]|nr:DUF1016 N-terminal domain-containing protein [Wolbachia endosymbiont of Culex quinquefasciatus]EEB55181.1 phage uncharacterized protein [Wolbachia endosymbiont of Culex quinquefasciatus JHB]